MEPVTLAVVSLAVLMLLLSFGVPIVFCFSGALAFMSIVGGVTMKGMMMWGLQQILSPTLLCIPLFIYAGSLMSESGIAKYLLEFVDVFVGRIRGGLGFVATLTCAILGAISGSTFTGLAATGNMLIPEMVSRGYPRAFATALITCSSILGVLIPPSTPMIIFGWVTGTNVLACFLSTVGPGIVTIIIFCGINFVLSRRFDLKLMPQLSKTEKRRQIAVRGWKALPALIMPVLILGGIYSGAMTPTEAAAVAVIYALPVGFFVYRGLNLRNAFGCTKDSAVSVGSIMIMIFCSMMLSQTYVVLQIPQAIVESVFSITDNSFLILLLINLILLFVGMIVNDTTGIILVAPLLLPLATGGEPNGNYLEFYQGFLLGLDSVKLKYGRSVNVDLYNTARDTARIREIVESDAFRKADLIVGPVYEEGLYPVIRFAEEKKIPVVSPLANIEGMNSDVLFQLAPDPSRKYEKAGDLVNGDKRVTLICTESADKEFEREMLALLGDSEYRRYTYKYEHPTARSADSPSDLTPLLENTDDNVFIILSDNEVDIDRILAALASADTSLTSRGRTAPRFVVLGNTRWNRYNTVDRAMFFKNRVIFFSTYHAKRDSETVRAFDDAYIRSFGALPTLFSYRGYDTAMIFAPAMYGDIEYDLEDRRYTPLQTTYRFGQNEGRENHVNRNWTRVNYNSDFTITIE